MNMLPCRVVDVKIGKCFRLRKSDGLANQMFKSVHAPGGENEERQNEHRVTYLSIPQCHSTSQTRPHRSSKP
jgi:hypothetical protein